MTVADLSAATEALQYLLELNVPRLAGGPVTVSTLRPERVGSANALNLYCYHVTEDPHTKLRRRQSTGQAIASSPLSLVLHYIVTAHVDTTGDFDALAEQRMLSHAMKTFHDYPVIEDGILIGTEPVMDPDFRGQNNRFEITMVQMNPLESLEFWANEDQFTAKPSAYYEVRPVEIEPEPPARVPGVVLTLGNFVFPLGTPQIAATEGELTFALPAELGGGMAPPVTVSPAKVGPVNPAPPPAWNILRLKGAALDKGQSQTLLISHPLWTRLFPDLPRIPVDMTQNASFNWSQTLADGEVTITVGEQLDVPRPDGTFTTVDVYPGAYTVSWAARLFFDQPDGPRFIEERSNTAQFTVNPRIVGIARDGGTGAVTLDFGGIWRLNRGRPPIVDAAAEPELDILLAVDGTGYPLWEPDDPMDPQPPGTFTITVNQLVYLPLDAANQPGLHTIRVVVEGADTQPFWIEIP